jgi:hypothetical protein
MIPNTTGVRVWFSHDEPTAVIAAWDSDGHPMIVGPNGLIRVEDLRPDRGFHSYEFVGDQDEWHTPRFADNQPSERFGLGQ